MKTIYKYPLPSVPGQNFTITAPRDAEFVHAGPDPQGNICVWFEVDPTAAHLSAKLGFHLTWTGYPLPDGVREHLASFVIGALVWHLYRLPWVQA